MPSKTDSSVEKPVLQCGALIFGYTIVRKLGCGGYGAVYEVEKNNVSYAAKAEIVNKKNEGTLMVEARVLRRLSHSPHACTLSFASKYESDGIELNVIIMTLLTLPLNKLRRACPEQRFTRSTAVRVAIQSLQAIRDLHSIGYLHRDVKAGNLAMSSDRRVMLIDFGFARRFIDIDDEGRPSMRKPRKRAGFVGTTRYCSKHVHKRKEQARRDDLWAWLYMVVEMITGGLPWSDLSDNKMASYKMEVGSRLYENCPQEFLFLHDHINSLEYRSKPNYDLLFRWLERIRVRCGILESDPFDWEKGGRYEEIAEKIEMQRWKDTMKEQKEQGNAVDIPDKVARWLQNDNMSQSSGDSEDEEDSSHDVKEDYEKDKLGVTDVVKAKLKEYAKKIKF